MTIGTSLFLIAVGAILRWAVSDAIEGVDLTTVGLILMVVGVVGLLFGIWQTRQVSGAADPRVDPRRDPRDPRY